MMDRSIQKRIKVSLSLFFGILLMAAGNAKAQSGTGHLLRNLVYQQIQANSDEKISLEFNYVPIEDALRKIADKVNAGLYFKASLLPEKTVTLTLKKVSVWEAIKAVLKGTGLEAYASGRNIILRKKEILNSIPKKVVIQTGTVSGTVTDAETGEPMPGASVFIEGTTKGDATDGEGKFLINDVEAGSYTLVARFIGYKEEKKEIIVNEDEVVTVSFSLIPNANELGELVVIGYGTKTQGSLTGSVETVEHEDLSARSRSTFQLSLQGNVAGLQAVSVTGQPGAAPTVRIRGISSFSASSAPLYVVDGVPILAQSVTALAFSSNTIAGINPNDIEKVTVLKDASATSIYGSLGANGVIMITTKSGSAGKTEVNIKAQRGFSQMATSDRNDPLSTTEMGELLIEGVINSNINPTIAAITDPQQAYAFLLSEGFDPEVNTDWFDVITQVGKYAQYDVSVSGGNNITRFYVSAGYYTQDAVTKGQGYERVTGRLNLDHTANEKFSINGRLSVARQNLSTVPGGGTGQNPVRSLYRLVPWLAPYDEDGNYSTDMRYNPELLRHENVYETTIYQLIGNVGVRYNITNELAVESKGGVDLSFSDDFRFWSPLWADGQGSNGRGMQYDRTWDNWNITNLLKFNRDYGDFGLEATLGQEAAKRQLKSVSTQANNYAADGLYTLANTAEPYIAWSSKAEATLLSYFLRTSFDYKEKYYLDLSGRRDGSSRFGRNVRYGNFWSVGASWNITKEAFMESVEFLDQLKLRVSYGLSGNQLGSYYGAQGYYSTGWDYGNQPGFALAQIESGDLSWETNKPLDIGIDFAVFDQRLTGSVDWYSRITADLYQDIPVSRTNGVSSLNYNVGSMKNSGVEITLNSHNIRSRMPGGFNWWTDFNISTQNNEILELSEDQLLQSFYIREPGGNFYQFYMRGYAGVDPQTGEALWYTDGTKTTTTTNFSEASSYKQKGKTALADFYGGLTNTISYKGVSLSVSIYFKWGGYIYDIWGQYTQSDGSAGLSAYGLINRMVYENRWKEPGDEAAYPKMVYRGNQSGLPGQHSTRFLYDGSYIRLRDVTISYDLPVAKMQLPVRGIEVYVRANNLYTYIRDDLLPYDPEAGISGLLDQNIPISKQIYFGIDVNF